MPDRKPHLLILGGTAEAIQLASAAEQRFDDRIEVTTSLAGRTRAPTKMAGTMRIGGFGGAEGLAAWLKSARIDMVVDATHPFAAHISANAHEACAATAVPRLIFGRRPWRAAPGDDWRNAPDLDSAAAALPDLGKRVFLSVGAQGLRSFAGVVGVHLVVRMIDPPVAALPLDDYMVVLGRGPFDETSELHLFEAERIDAVVSRNSGGTATFAKIGAARRLGLPVIMVAPPPPAPGAFVDCLKGALQWIEERVAV